MIQLPESIQNDLNIIAEVSEDLNMQSYVVGGFPRDIIGGYGITEDTDIDLTEKNGNAFDLAFFVAAKLNLPQPEIYDASGTAMVTMPSGRVLEFHNAFHNVPHIIDQLFALDVVPTPINKDVFSRDFTINTLLFDIKDNVILDLTGMGIDDIKNKVLRTPLRPDKTLGIEPKRLLRGIRFVVQFDLEVDPEYEAIAHKFVPQLIDFMQKRPDSRMVGDTVRKAFAANPEKAYQEFEKYGLIPYIPRVEEMDEIVRQKVFASNSWYKKAEDDFNYGDEEDLSGYKSYNYLDYGHKGADDKIWIYDGRFRVESAFDPNTKNMRSHSLLWGFDFGKYWNGRYDKEKNIVSVRSPDTQMNWNTTPKIPSFVMSGISSNFGDAQIECFNCREASSENWYKEAKFEDNDPICKLRDKKKKSKNKELKLSPVMHDEIGILPKAQLEAPGPDTSYAPDAGYRATPDQKMVQHLLDNREKHRAYIRRRRNEEKKKQQKMFDIFDAIERGDHDALDRMQKKKKKKVTVPSGTPV